MKTIVILLICLFTSPALHAQRPTLEQFIDTYAAGQHFSGTVLVHSSGKVDLVRSFGLADRAFDIPNTPQTRYWIASITKLFTASLIMRLHEQGRIDLDATIQAYLPDYRGAASDKVTLRQLLHHTSGIDNPDKVQNFEQAMREGMPMYMTPMTIDDIVSRYCSGALVHEPGKVFDYNNAEYIILGKIIEQRTGKAFADVLDESILRPLGMKNTGMLGGGRIVAKLAPTYLMRPGSGVLTDDFPVFPENWFAAGSMYSTAGDLLRFAEGLFGGKVISSESLDQLIQPGLDDYGFGVWSYDVTIAGKSHHVIKRPGRIMGAQTQLYHVMSPDLTIILLANTGSTDLDEFASEIGKLILSSQ